MRYKKKCIFRCGRSVWVRELSAASRASASTPRPGLTSLSGVCQFGGGQQQADHQPPHRALDWRVWQECVSSMAVSSKQSVSPHVAPWIDEEHEPPAADDINWDWSKPAWEIKANQQIYYGFIYLITLHLKTSVKKEVKRHSVFTVNPI